ncbi:Ig-like domain-containing protein [Leeuwenhoekiella sp. H156]|uniref:Ig-like domain-containing protein n=1 Tax=Leeuwenhoekiella sp. H156 TaxID=3450128 RepID=UPI003FA481A0
MNLKLRTILLGLGYILLPVFWLTTYAQADVYATQVIDEDHVSNSALAIDENLGTRAQIESNSGLALGIGAYTGFLELGYTSTIPANTTTYLKIQTEDDILRLLLSGGLGNLLSDVLGIALVGNQEILVEARNGNITILQADSVDSNTFDNARVRLVTDTVGEYYIAITPDQAYNRIYIANRLGSLIGLNNTRTLDVFGGYYATGTLQCNDPAFTSFDGDGLSLDILQIGDAGVQNPECAIDNDATTFSELSLGVIDVAASIEQIIYFDRVSQPDEDFKISLRVDPTLIALGVLNNIQFEAYNGTALISSSNLASLLNLDLLGILQSGAVTQVPFEVAGPADRIVVRYSSLLGVNAFQRLDLFDVALTPAIPIIDAASQNLEVCAGDTASLIATSASAGAQMRWYDSPVGGNLLASVASGDAFVTAPLSTDTTFYVASFVAGCTEESGRLAVNVSVNPLPESGDITVLGFDLPICIPEILNIVPTTTLNGSFNYYLDSSGSVAITNGLVQGNLTYTINAAGELEVEGLTEADNPFRVYVSLVDAVTGCENAPGDLKLVEVTLDGGPQPTIALDPVTTDNILNTAEINSTVSIRGSVGGDAQIGDPVQVTVNTFAFNTTVASGLTFTVDVPGAQLLADDDLTIEAAVTSQNLLLCETTVQTAVNYTIDDTPPAVPTVDFLVTNDNTPTLTGAADSIDNLSVSVDGVVYAEGDGNLIDNGDNTWTLNVPNPLADGIYDVIATAADVAGNTSIDVTLDELTIDTLAPTVPTVNTQQTSDTTPVITGTADSMDKISVTVNGITYDEGDGNLVDNGNNTWTLTIPAGNVLTDGVYDVAVEATDAAGNISTDATVDELTINTSLPTTPQVTPLITTNTSPTLNGTADSVDNLTVNVAGVTYAEGDGNLTDNGDDTWTLVIPVVLAEGTYEVTATATQGALSATDPTTDELVIDLAPPTVPTVNFLTTNDSTPIVTGTADSIDNLTVSVDGTTYIEGDGNLVDNGNNTWTLTIPSPLADGAYDVMATATDAAGNASVDTTVDELTIDTTAPVIPTVDFLVTSDNTPVLTGTADSGANLTIIVGGISYAKGDGNLIDNGDNTWTLNIPIPLADRVYDVIAISTDAVGNTSMDETFNELTIDTTVPTIPTVDPLVTNDNTPTITGTADSADDLVVVVAGVTYTEGDGNLVDNGDYTWTLTIPSPLADGAYDVVATVTDAAGNASTDATIDELTIDTTAPTIPTVDPLLTNDNTPTITGTADSADDLVVVVAGVTYTEGDGNLVDNGDYTWTLTIPSPLADGAYDVVATVTDAAGNASTDATIDELTIDTTAPTIPTVDPLLTNDNTPTITGTADSADDLIVVVAGVTYTEGDGNLVDNGDNTWSLTIPTPLPDGTYDVMATATDAAGNASTDATIDELTIDTTPPTIPTVDVLVTNDNTPTITGTADSADDLVVVVAGVTYTEGDGNLVDNGDNTWSLTIPTPLPDGTYDVMATATDAAGNASTDTTIDELTIDTTSPTIPTVDPLVTNDNTPTITGTADSADDLVVVVAGVTYTEGDGNLVDNGDNTWTLTIPSPLSDGTYDVMATATDAAGNASTDATVDELTIDTTPPTVPTVDPLVTNDNTPTITGTADSADDLVVVVDGVTYTEGDGNLVDNGDNTWTLTIPSTLADGTYDVMATATDDFGNSSSDVTTNELTIQSAIATGNPQQAFCISEAAVVADLELDQDTVIWYDAATGGNVLADNTLLEDGKIYYAALVVLGAEFDARFAVTVTLTNPVTPTISASVNTPCLGAEVTYTTQSGMTNYNWQVSASGNVISGGSATDNFVVVIWDIPGIESVSVSYEANTGCILNTAASVEVTPVACSDLTISKTVDNDMPAIGEVVVYTVTVENSGSVSTSLIEVEDKLPSDLELVSFQTSIGTYNSSTGIWLIPELAANDSAVLMVSARVKDGENYLNQAIIINSYPMDLDLGNNRAEVDLNPDCLMVFNEFSPNGDGINDLFKIRCLEQYPENTLMVFNRVGQKVFSSVNYKNDWDGIANVTTGFNTSKGLPSGTYYYVLEINGGRTLKGWLYLAN